MVWCLDGVDTLRPGALYVDAHVWAEVSTGSRRPERERGSILAAINSGRGAIIQSGSYPLVSVGVGVGTPSSVLDA